MPFSENAKTSRTKRQRTETEEKVNPNEIEESHLDLLQMTETVVCEKTDGVRYFLLEVVLPRSQ